MHSRNGSNWHVLLIAALVVIAPLAMYGGGYVGLTCGMSRNTSNGAACRVFRSQWQAILFLPACVVESAITGHETLPAWRDPSIGPRPRATP